MLLIVPGGLTHHGAVCVRLQPMAKPITQGNSSLFCVERKNDRVQNPGIKNYIPRTGALKDHHHHHWVVTQVKMNIIPTLHTQTTACMHYDSISSRSCETVFCIGSSIVDVPHKHQTRSATYKLLLCWRCLCSSRTLPSTVCIRLPDLTAQFLALWYDSSIVKVRLPPAHPCSYS